MPSKKSITQLLSDVSNGEFEERCTAKLADVIAAVQAGHGDGELTIKLKFKKDKRMIQVDPKLTAKVPQMGVDKSMFFVDEQNQLTDEDPKQMTIPLPRPAKVLVSLKGGESADDTKPKKDN